MYLIDSLAPRLAAQTEIGDGCWLFVGTIDANGYGLLWDNRRRNNSKAHRIAFEIEHGPIPEDHDVHHRCEVRACVNPAHLALLPSAEHNSLHHRKTHCKQGHEYSGRWRQGQQVCLVCSAAASRRSYERKRAASGAGSEA